MYTTVIRTDGAEDSVFINGVVSQEIERLKKKHESELGRIEMMEQSRKRELAEESAKRLKVLKSRKMSRREKIRFQIERIVFTPYAIWLDQKDRMLLVRFRMRKRINRMTDRCTDFLLRHGFIELVEDDE